MKGADIDESSEECKDLQIEKWLVRNKVIVVIKRLKDTILVILVAGHNYHVDILPACGISQLLET